MPVYLGDIAPDFTADTTAGRLRFHRWLGSSWGMLFSHPRDFTPVCTTELAALARLEPQFAARGVKLIGLSVDTVLSHEQWAAEILESHGVAINFPIIADLDRAVARLYGMLHPQHDTLHAVRTVFVLDPAKKVRLTITYPQTCGRNFEELLRVIDSLQLTDSHAVSTPAGWRAGDAVIILPALSDAQARTRFPRGWQALTSYLRLTPDPRV